VEDLVRASWRLFAAAWYAAASLDAVRERAGATKGALDRTERRAARAICKGAVLPCPSDPLTSRLYGGPSESGMAVAGAENPSAALRKALDGLPRQLDTIGRG